MVSVGQMLKQSGFTISSLVWGMVVFRVRDEGQRERRGRREREKGCERGKRRGIKRD